MPVTSARLAGCEDFTENRKMKHVWSFSRLPIAVFVFATAALLLFPELAWAQEEGVAAPAASSASGNKFFFIIKSVGWLFGIILLGLAMWMVALVVLLALDLRMAGAIPVGFVDEFAETVNQRNFKGAYDMAKADPSFLGRVLTAGMSRLQYGLEDAREAAANALESLKADKDQKNNYLATIATLGPLLGLVGTVFGMIGAFMTLSQEAAASNATKLAEDIAHALSVTLIGVAISCPAIAFNTFFRNRISRVMLDVGHIADDLLTQMYHNSKKGGPPVAPTGPSVQAPTTTK
jgi:biopolymer transport protein ExbB